MIRKIREMKEDLKSLANKIRNGKSARKPKNRNESNIFDYDRLYGYRYDYRHMHIAYCLMKGRKMEEIENPSPSNLPNDLTIDRYIKEYTYEEDVCSCA